MARLLRVDSSPMGEGAISRQLTNEFVHQWLGADPHGTIITRDLTITSIPAVSAAWVSANYIPEASRTKEQTQLLTLSREFIAELLDATECVLGMPMHNWGPPSSFKLWVDQIVTPQTKLTRPLTGKKTTFIIAAGGTYSPGSRDESKNHLVPWLRTVFASLGADEMRFVLADGTRHIYNGKFVLAEGPRLIYNAKIERTKFIATHKGDVRALFAREQAALDIH